MTHIKYVISSLGFFGVRFAAPFRGIFVIVLVSVVKFPGACSLRYILVDWLVEVACMKGFSSLTLHMAVNMVDRYLRVHRTTRSRLQLLGVSAMVLCSRYAPTQLTCNKN